MRCYILAAIVAVVGLLGQRAGADGLIVIPESRVVVPGHFTFAPLEVMYHRVSCDINDQVAVTSVDQEFHNPNNARLEGDYLFPVPPNAQIDKFSMDIDGAMVDAELVPAEKARKIYEEIVRKSRDPALLEYAGRALFRVHVFPIEPNGNKRIKLKYTELLKQENSLLDYRYTLDTEKYSSRPLKDVSIAVTIHGASPLTTLYSPTHDVEIKRHGETDAVVGYEARDVRPDRDFHLFIGRKCTPVGLSVLTYRPDAGKEGYFALLAAPSVDEKAHPPMPKDVVFVIDTSGSMSGEKIEQARNALKFCINTLNEGDRFDVVRFSTEAERLFGTLTDASAENRKKATEFAAGLKADGGTAIDDALRQAIDERPTTKADGERLFMAVFMTDGQPTVGEENPDVILSHVKEESKGQPVRIFSFGVGTDVNTKLLDEVAEQTRGYSAYVLPGENLELAMSTFWGKVQDPVLANLEVDTGSAGVRKMYPKQLPDLFKGDQLVAFGTYTKGGPTAIKLAGMVNGQPVTFSEDATFAEETDGTNDWIAKLWAMRRIGNLLEEIRRHGENAELKDEIVTLARRWGLVTPYTAMLILEDEKSRNVPVAVQSLRELSIDRRARRASAAGMDSMLRQESTGASAVKDSLNANNFKAASTMGALAAAAAQSAPRDQFDGQTAGALDKTSSPATPLSTDDAKTLNLGTQTTNGWQTAQAAGEGGRGYRVVTSYAQQSRLVNNRAFFLNGNQWTDATIQNHADATHHKIVFGTEEYFAWLSAHPLAAEFLSLGGNVSILVDGDVIDVVQE